MVTIWRRPRAGTQTDATNCTPQHFARGIKGNQELGKLTAELPVALLRSQADEADDVFFNVPVMAMFLFILECLQHEQIANGCFERVESEGLFKEVLWWGKVCEEGAPESEFCLACTLYDDIEIFTGG